MLRLIGHAQAGSEPTHELALQPGPLPRFDGIAPLPVASPIQAQNSGNQAGARIPPLMPDKITQYKNLFDRQPLQAGMLPGEQARSIFDRSGLPNETLGRIWALVDTEQRGALSAPEFIVAMHLLTSSNSGALRTLPSILPPAILEVAAGRGPPARQSPRPGNAGLPRQLTGQMRTGSPLGRGAQPGSDWLVTSADKARFDQLYATLDKTNKGYITGEEAVPFLSQSNLPEDALAQVWDLSDVNSQGQLNRDEFAVAMYLIRQQRINPSTPLPTTLPANLIPPSMRSQARQVPAAASPFDPPPMVKPPPPQPKSAMDDLFGLDTSPAPPAPRQDPMSTGGSGSDPFAGGSAHAAPGSPVGGGNMFKPSFVPSSSFGRGLTAQHSGSPITSQPSASEDLLADNNPEESKNITGESTELANLSNQISTLSTQMQETQSKRTATQNDLKQTNTQKQNFQQRLSQLRTLYEKEAQDTRSLEEQLRKSRTETQKLQGECMTLEGSLADAQAQHQQVLAALQADQQENTSLRERIRVANGEITQLKPQIEKLKMEARQQKGLVAINKKQLLTTEGERDKLKAEGEELGRAPGEATSRGKELGSATDTPSGSIASPALSTSSGNNPFFKRTASTDIMGVFSPPSGPDEIFGPSAGQAPAPFRPQTTGTSTASAGSGSFSTPPSSTPVLSRQTTLRTDNPPPPPESRQISSSFLPFGGATESVSSSRQVSPPASRADGSVTDGPTAAGQTEESSKDDEVKTPTAADGKAIASPGKEKAAPFGEDDKEKAKADFDNAFAAFTSSKSAPPAETAAPKTKSAFDSEFPPISEIERDDESDSESEQGGFDDDFAPKSPEKNKNASQAAAPVPPTVVDTTAKSTDAAKEEKPTSPATITAPAAAQSSSVDDIFGPSASTATAAATAPASQPKGVFDDLDDDFEGLEEAKEGSADDDFANISRSGFEDYNAVFDSPPPSQPKGDHGGFGNESSFDFIPSNPAGADAKGTESHDWDAIFAGLDSADPAGNTAADAKKDEGKLTATTTERPAAVGRALTDKGVHDDPILKSLTGMGYPRPDALAALEKYDYNLERVSTAASHSFIVDH